MGRITKYFYYAAIDGQVGYCSSGVIYAYNKRDAMSQLNDHFTGGFDDKLMHAYLSTRPLKRSQMKSACSHYQRYNFPKPIRTSPPRTKKPRITKTSVKPTTTKKAPKKKRQNLNLLEKTIFKIFKP